MSIHAPLRFHPSGPAADAVTLAAARNFVATAATPDLARAAIALVEAWASGIGFDEGLLICHADLVERLRVRNGMIGFWTSVHKAAPGNGHALRMLMRWYRREGLLDEGLQLLRQACPAAERDPEQFVAMLSGLRELQAVDELVALFDRAEGGSALTRKVRVQGANAILEAGRAGRARRLLAPLEAEGALSPSARDTLSRIDAVLSLSGGCRDRDGAELIRTIVPRVGAQPRPFPEPVRIGRVLFFTGQLGAGGAERQMTRIASEFQLAWSDGRLIGGVPVTAPPIVCVRQARTETGADFFLPFLKAHQVDTRILSEAPEHPLSSIGGLDPRMAALLQTLPEDLLKTSLRLIPLLQETRPDAVYLWQDGGVLAGAFAALAVGTPRIILSWRGLPPNLRPELHRVQMGPLYQALAELPHVVLSANSRAAAAAYAGWLGVPESRIRVIHNASGDLDPSPAPESAAYWDEIVSRSPGCKKTVLGVFRFDQNKRPIPWINYAAAHAERRSDVRFLIVGAGAEFAVAQRRIVELGMGDRIFLAGLRRDVPFFMSRSDLLLHLARMEGLPNVIIEAQLCGLPVVATPAGGTAEIVAHGRTGHVLPDADRVCPDQVRAAVDPFLDDPELTSRFGAEARRLASPKFKKEAVLAKTAQVILKGALT
jgi:glycosyltransferase involved in cell wall biosynthesis